jgi:hypothetical protein
MRPSVEVGEIIGLTFLLALLALVLSFGQLDDLIKYLGQSTTSGHIIQASDR